MGNSLALKITCGDDFRIVTNLNTYPNINPQYGDTLFYDDGRGDLYDLGFRYENIQKYGIKIEPVIWEYKE